MKCIISNTSEIPLVREKLSLPFPCLSQFTKWKLYLTTGQSHDHWKGTAQGSVILMLWSCDCYKSFAEWFPLNPKHVITLLINISLWKLWIRPFKLKIVPRLVILKHCAFLLSFSCSTFYSKAFFLSFFHLCLPCLNPLTSSNSYHYFNGKQF